MFEHQFRHEVVGLETKFFLATFSATNQLYVKHFLDQFE